MLRSVEAQSDAPEHELNLRASDLWGDDGVVLLKEVKARRTSGACFWHVHGEPHADWLGSAAEDAK